MLIPYLNKLELNAEVFYSSELLRETETSQKKLFCVTIPGVIPKRLNKKKNSL